jgi:hypothetical protein
MEKIVFSHPVDPFRGFRGIDDFGAGGYGAPRMHHGKREEHLGLDCLAYVGDDEVSPICGDIVHIGIAYPDSNLGSIHIQNERFKARLLYGKPLPTLIEGARVTGGDVIGVVQDVAGYHEAKQPGKHMLNHVHMDLWVRKEGLWVRTDPTPFLVTAATG